MVLSLLTPFVQHDEHKHVYFSHKGGLRCYAIRLKDTKLCVFSPVLGLRETVVESLEAIGKVAFVLAFDLAAGVFAHRT